MAALAIAFLAGLMAAGCSNEREQDQADYQAVCQGPPLRTVEERNKAMEDGYNISFRYGCIEKASFVAVNEQKAKWEAANTPEALAKRKAELMEQRARDEEERARKAAAAEERKAPAALPDIVLREVDANTAAEADIASVISVGPTVAAQIVEERAKRRFNDWADLIHRVVGLSAAQTAVYASLCGLNVNGKSLDGAPPNPTMAALIYQKYQRYPKN